MARVIPNPKGGGGVETLPPPGDARREVLDARQDQLDEAAEAPLDEGQAEVNAINPKALRVESELASQFNALEVSGALPEYRYLWCYTGQHGTVIKWQLAQGYEVVQGEMPEAMEQKGLAGDTTRRIGDTILLRIRLDRYLRIERARQQRQQAQEASSAAGLYALAEKHPAIKVREFNNPAELSPDGAQRRGVTTRQLARGAATRRFDTLLRQGRVPGMPAPGLRGR
jgi:hypothetical protein